MSIFMIGISIEQTSHSVVYAPEIDFNDEEPSNLNPVQQNLRSSTMDVSYVWSEVGHGGLSDQEILEIGKVLEIPFELFDTFRSEGVQKIPEKDYLFRILLNCTSPVRREGRRYSDEDRSFISEWLDKMLANGFIQPSESEFRTDLVLASKSDGSKRVDTGIMRSRKKRFRIAFSTVPAEGKHETLFHPPAVSPSTKMQEQ